jgi:hypothetical protein
LLIITLLGVRYTLMSRAGIPWKYNQPAESERTLVGCSRGRRVPVCHSAVLGDGPRLWGYDGEFGQELDRDTKINRRDTSIVWKMDTLNAILDFKNKQMRNKNK